MTCPICAKSADGKYRPFCSKRCADIDLGKWLGGNYTFASNDPDDLDIAEDAQIKETPPVH